jgi:hypothetical protein
MSADQPPGRRPKGLLMLRTQAMPQDVGSHAKLTRGFHPKLTHGFGA